jgi:hypothetical protein
MGAIPTFQNWGILGPFLPARQAYLGPRTGSPGLPGAQSALRTHEICRSILSSPQRARSGKALGERGTRLCRQEFIVVQWWRPLVWGWAQGPRYSGGLSKEMRKNGTPETQCVHIGASSRQSEKSWPWELGLDLPVSC